MQNRKRDSDVENRLVDSVGEGEGRMFRENSIETCILSRMKQITSPGWMHETSARAWCTGKTQRDRVEREVGGGMGMGTHVNPWLIHFSVWQKPLQCCKVISLKLIKINEKKKTVSSLLSRGLLLPSAPALPPGYSWRNIRVILHCKSDHSHCHRQASRMAPRFLLPGV